MSKKRYITKLNGEKVERTPANLSILAGEMIRKASNLVEQDAKEANKLFVKAKHLAHESLIFGAMGSAYLLAYLNFNGYGAEKNIEKTKLWLLIGTELDDNQCTPVVKSKSDRSGAMEDYLKTNPVYSEKQKKLAKVYADTISGIITEYGDLKDCINKSKTIEDCIVAKGVFNEDAEDPGHTLQVLGGLYEDDAIKDGCPCIIL